MAGVANSGVHNQVAGNATIIYPFDSYCKNGSDVTPTIKGGSGGTFSSTTGMVLDSSTGTIDLSACTPGTYTISYTVPGYNVATDVVTILAASDSSFSYPSLVNIRSGYLIPTITGATGGTFSGSAGLYIDSTTGTIDLAKTSTDYSSFTATYTVGANCPSSTSISLVIMTPFKLRVDIPANNTSGLEIKPQMSNGSCTINWGDGNIQTVTGNTTHNYASSSSIETYDVHIYDTETSKFTGFTGTWAGGYGQAAQAANYDKTILQWGDIEWQNNSWFLGPTNSHPNYDQPLRLAAPNGSAHKPNLSQVTSLENLFKVAINGDRNDQFEDVNNNLADWDVSTITNMKHAFSIGRGPANRPSDGQPNILQLSSWDVSNVTDFYGFARGAFYNGNGNHTNNIGLNMTNWDTSSAEIMTYMLNCRGTRTGVENFDTSNVTDMSHMFNSSTPGNVDFKTKLVNGTVRWSVKKVTNFTQMFAGNYIDGGSSFTDSTFPTNWWISGEGQDVNMSAMFGPNQYNQGRFGSLTDMDAFATKTIASGSSPYGSSYTAWDMSKVTNLANWAYSGNTQMSGKNFNISSWQISNKTTTLDNLFRTYDNANISYSMDQDLGHWDITNVTAIGNWMENTRTGYGGEVSFSRANYDSLLINWGAHASSVQSGVTLNMGTSKYTPGGAAEAGRTALINAGWTIVDGGAVYSNTNALSFNGSTEFINTGTTPNALVGSSSAYTVSVYVYPQGNGVFNQFEQEIIGAANYWSSAQRFSFFLKSASGSAASLSPGYRYGSSANGNLYTTTSNPTVPKNQWSHVAFTFDGNTTHKIYVNGTAVVTQTNGSAQTVSSTMDLNIAARNENGSTTTYFNGRLDELMIWNTELTQGEIQAYANVVGSGSGSIPDPNVITGLQLWNRMGD